MDYPNISIHRKLKQFLEAKRVLEEFIYNVEHQSFDGYWSHAGNRMDAKKQIQEGSNAAIGYAFNWSQTTRGHNFWESLSGEWSVYVYNNAKAMNMYVPSNIIIL